MVCNVIEECRCYAYKGETEQFCGVRKGPNVLPCPKDCCSGGCPINGSRQPFRFIDRPRKSSVLTSTDRKHFNTVSNHGTRCSPLHRLKG